MIEYKWQRIQLILRIQQQWDWDNDQYQEYQRAKYDDKYDDNEYDRIQMTTNTINITNTTTMRLRQRPIPRIPTTMNIFINEYN